MAFIYTYNTIQKVIIIMAYKALLWLAPTSLISFSTIHLRFLALLIEAIPQTCPAHTFLFLQVSTWRASSPHVRFLFKCPLRGAFPNYPYPPFPITMLYFFFIELFISWHYLFLCPHPPLYCFLTTILFLFTAVFPELRAKYLLNEWMHA